MSTWQQYMGDIWVPSAPSGEAGTRLKDDLKTLRDYSPKSSFSETTNPGPTNDDSEGMAYQTTDPAGTITQQVFDRAGRRVALVENVQGTTGDDKNRTTGWSYTPDGEIETLTALNSTTGDQTTAYAFGVTTTGSTLNSNDLLHTETYPDGGVVTHEYNRQGERIKTTDQNGTVHEFDFDKLGRQTQDRVPTLSSGIDDAVRRIALTFEVRGMVETITSFDDATSGDVVNQVENLYNTFSQLASQAQEHDGAVSGTTPKVEYAYADGSTNTVRPASVTYPNGRILDYDYTATFASELSRTGRLIFDGDNVVDYKYLGLGSFVQVDYIEPSVRYDLATGSGADPYAGLDRFGRVIDLLWRKYSTTAADLEHLQYGYDRASNRIWRKNLVSAGLSTPVYMDELYAYDGLYQLQDMKRGQLTGSPPSGITGLKFEQQWGLDPTGNWKNFRENATGGGSWTLNQTRTANEVNEITGIGATTGADWADPVYDDAGNMTTIPQPAAPTTTYTAVYDAWNQMVRLLDGAAVISQFAYDGRAFRTVTQQYITGVLSQSQHFYYNDAWQNLEVRLGSNPSSADADRQFVWGLRYIDDLVLRDSTLTDSLDERHFALQDDNWSVTALCNRAGSIQARVEYSPYGTATPLTADFAPSGQPFPCEYSYCGYYSDFPASVYHVRYRDFLATAGTWMSRNPYGYLDGLSLLEYIGSNPTGGWDSLGLRRGVQRNVRTPTPGNRGGDPPPEPPKLSSNPVVRAPLHTPEPSGDPLLDAIREADRRAWLRSEYNSQVSDAVLEAQKAGVPWDKIQRALNSSITNMSVGGDRTNYTAKAVRAMSEEHQRLLKELREAEKRLPKTAVGRHGELCNESPCGPKDLPGEVHHVIPQDLKDKGKLNPLFQMNNVLNKCCMPRRLHNLTRGGGKGGHGSWYNDFVDDWLSVACGYYYANTPCVESARDIIRPLLPCCFGPQWCSKDRQLNPSKK